MAPKTPFSPHVIARQGLLCTVIGFTMAASLGAQPRPDPFGDERPPTPATAPSSRPARTISVLYVEGYPRWEFRYIQTAMIREPSVDISTLLTSADAEVAGGGDKPIREFPRDMKALAEFDVVVLGDVDPAFFTEGRLELMRNFVADHRGGLAMIAGSRFSPHKYKGTPVEGLLPVKLMAPPDGPATRSTGFRPLVTRPGASSALFRFLDDPAANEKFLQDELGSLYWHCRGVAPKDGATVLAEHPTDATGDGAHVPLVAFGGQGGGRTAFFGIDDTWRWRSNPGDLFVKFWLAALRSLAERP